jgi:hypothetical protein
MKEDPMRRMMLVGLFALTVFAGGRLARAASAEVEACDIDAVACPCQVQPAPREDLPAVEAEIEAEAPQTDAGDVLAALKALAHNWLNTIVELFAPAAAMEQPVVVADDRAGLLESTLLPEEVDFWFESQPRDEHGKPALTSDELAALTAEVRGLIELLCSDELTHKQRERVEATILIKVALADAHRFGGDAREDLFDLLASEQPDGRRIDDLEAATLLSVVEGRELLYEALPWVIDGAGA